MSLENDISNIKRGCGSEEVSERMKCRICGKPDDSGECDNCIKKRSGKKEPKDKKCRTCGKPDSSGECDGCIKKRSGKNEPKVTKKVKESDEIKQPETLKIDQSTVVFKKDNGFVARESVDFRSIIDGVNKDIREGYGETCGVLPGEDEEIVVEDPKNDIEITDDETVEKPEEVIQVPTTDIQGQDQNISQEMDQSAARNAEVVAKEEALKQEVGQNNAQEQADEKQPTTQPQACETEKIAIVEEPKEELVVEEPNGEIAIESNVGEGKEERGKRDGTGPYKYSRIRQEGFTKGRRRMAGKKCVINKESKEDLGKLISCSSSDSSADRSIIESKYKDQEAPDTDQEAALRHANKGEEDIKNKKAAKKKVNELNIADTEATKHELERIKNKGVKKRKGSKNKSLFSYPTDLGVVKLSPTESKTNEAGAYDVMRGQAGPNRVVIRWKYADSSGTMSSHFASVEEFLTQNADGHRKIEWYQVGNGEKVAMTESKLVGINESTEEIIQAITNGTDPYFGYAHFHSSNMADYTLMSSTISDMVNVYGINEVEAADIVQALTHGDNESKTYPFGVSELSDFRSIFEGINKESKVNERNNMECLKCGFEFAGSIGDECSKCGAKNVHVVDKKENLEPRRRGNRYNRKRFGGDTGVDADFRESKINEEEALAGPNATVAPDAGALPPTNDEPKIDPAQNPETHDNNDQQPDAEEHGEKEYLGKKGDDEYYYLMATSDEGDGSTGGVATESRVNEKKTKCNACGAVGNDIPGGLCHACQKGTMEEIKEGTLFVDASDDDYRNTEKKLRNAQELDAKDKDLIAKMSKAKKETDELEKMYKMDNSKVPNESKIHEGYSSLQIVDAEGKVVADAEEQEIDPNNIKDFLLKNMDDLELTEITPDIVKKYLLVDEESTEDEDMTRTPEEGNRMKVQGQPPFKDEEVIPGQSVASESVVMGLLDKFKLNETVVVEELGVDSLLEKFGLAERDLTNYVSCNCGWEGDVDFGKPKCPECGCEYRLDQYDNWVPVKEPDVIESLLNKFQLSEATPVEFKGRPKEDIRDRDLTGQAVTPEQVDPSKAAPEVSASATPVEPVSEPGAEAPIGAGTEAGPGPGVTGATGGGVPGGAAEPIAPVQAQDMSNPESAKAYIQSEYPEEPFTSTAIAYADSMIADPKVYGAVRQMNWGGIWGDSDTFLKQAKIVGEYKPFSPDAAKALVDKFGNSAKYKLARETRPVVYVVLRDVGAGVEPVSLSELKGMTGAREVQATENQGEVKIIY